MRDVEALSSALYFGNGANRTKIATDGTVTFEGTATGWEDITGNLNSASIRGSAGKADYDDAEDMVVLQPSGVLATDADVISAKYQLRHKAKAGAPLKLHIHWRQTSADTRIFSWKYRIINNGAASTLTWSEAVNVNATGAANAFTYVSGNLDQITILGDIATTGLELSSIIQVKLARTDAVTGNIYIYDIDGHVEIDSATGSSTEYTK